jgi:hypothetical protein
MNVRCRVFAIHSPSRMLMIAQNLLRMLTASQTQIQVQNAPNAGTNPDLRLLFTSVKEARVRATQGSQLMRDLCSRTAPAARKTIRCLLRVA